jgi:hypothetical protein
MEIAFRNQAKASNKRKILTKRIIHILEEITIFKIPEFVPTLIVLESDSYDVMFL